MGIKTQKRCLGIQTREGRRQSALWAGAWQYPKTVRVSVVEARDRRPQNRASFAPLARLSHTGMWPGSELGRELAEPAPHQGGQTPGLPASCLCLHLLGTFLGKDESCQK